MKQGAGAARARAGASDREPGGPGWRGLGKRVLIAAVLVVASRAEPVAAGTCGGGGGSSGGSSSGGSSSGGGGDSSSSSSDSSSSSTPACHDVSDVVGYRQCTGFGRWANNLKIPMIVVELSTSVRSFTSPLGERAGTVTHDSQSFTYRAVGTERGGGSDDAVAVTSTMRIGMGAPRGIYGALEFELGGLVSGAAHAEMTSAGELGTPSIEQTSATVFGGLGVVGAQATRGRGNFGVELAGGVRGVSYLYESRYLACETSDRIGIVRPVLEARARAAMWVTPLITLGVTVGSSVIEEHNWSAGLFFAAHSRTFGGGR